MECTRCDLDVTTMLDVCRICLCTGGRMFTMNKYKLQDTFEHITGISLQEDNTLPRMLCTECAQKLSNCRKLRAKSLRANAILTELSIQHGDLTLQVIETIDRNINQLNSHLHTKLYEPDHYDYLIEHTDEQTDINMADVEIKTDSIDEIYLDENDLIAEEATLADQEIEDHIPPPADRQKTTDSNNKNDSLLNTNEFQKQLVVMLERMEFKYENDIGIDIDGSVAECGVVVKQEYPGEDTSVGRQRDPFSEREMYPSCSGRTLLKDSALDDDIKKTPGTGILNAEHVEIRADEVQERLITDDDKIKTKSVKRPRVQLDVTDRSKTQRTVVMNAEIYKKSLGEFIWSTSNNARRISKIDGINNIKDTNPTINSSYFACDSCSYVTSLKYRLIRHVKSHENRKCYICMKKFTSTTHLKVHLRIHTDERPYSCEMCGKKFIASGALKIHLKMHTGEKPYTCEICGNKFIQKGNLKVHQRVHTGEKPYSCKICGKKFIKNSELNRHQPVHTGERPYSCEICGKAFAESNNLKSHVRIHTGEKPYSCEICGKAFAKSSNLKSHVKIHTGEKPYSCEICGKAFTQSSNLKNHVRIHADEKTYSCEICGKKFKDSRTVKIHLRLHSGEKSYSCEICKLKFKKLVHLQKHVIVHTGVKPYSCEICDKKFTLSGTLKRHLRVHANDK